MTLLPLVIAAAFGWATAAVAEQMATEHAEATAAITNVTVVDVETGELREDQTIIIGAERILAIEPSGGFKRRDGIALVNGGGKYAIPGLWDMHVHMPYKPAIQWDLHEPKQSAGVQRQTYMPSWVAFGVVGLRDMSGGKWFLEMRKRIQAAELDGPHLIIGSPVLEGPYPIWPGAGTMAIANPTEAFIAVQELHEQGYDFLKPYTLLSPESYRAIHAAAAERGMSVAGEVPLSVSAWEAASLGQRSIEHLTGLEIACSAREDDLRAEYVRAVSAITADTKQSVKVSLWNRGEWEALSSFDAQKCQRLYRHLRNKGVWVTPTLVIQRRISYPDIPQVKENPYLKYITKSAADVASLIETYDPERRLRSTYDHRVDAIEDMHDAGIGILAGSDEQAGFWLHQELQIFVDAGLTPLEALQTATISPATYLGREHELGSVEPGKFADIVLLNSNPLDDIENTLDIHAVVLKGRIHDRGTLDRMLAQLEADARARERAD